MMKRRVLHLLSTFGALPMLLLGLGMPLLPQMQLRDPASVPELKNWGLKNDLGNSHIHAMEAWNLEEGSREVVVAVIDTGIDPDHIDLKHNLWHDPATGAYGWDFTTDTANPKDEHGHGTHVAGIIGAALNRGAGVSGVVHKVSIMAVKYYSEKASGAQNLRNSIRALSYAIDHGANIINYSGGGPEFSMDEYVALKRAREKGVLLVAAAGNEKSDGDAADNYYYPCAYRLDNIICVAATTVQNKLLPSSNWGKNSVDVAAPGENILSTVPGGKYAYMSGTSQATAFVTGVAHLLKSRRRDLTPQEMKRLIRLAVDPIPAIADKVAAGGKINAHTALMVLDRRTAPVALIAPVARQPAQKQKQAVSDL